MKQPNLISARRRAIGIAGKTLLYTLALIGLVWLIAGPVVRLFAAPMFETQIIRSLPSPDGRAHAEVEVRKGGFGTVWTTRVHLRSGPDGEGRWTIYQAKDSDFVPPLRWADRDTLIVTLPCERFDYASNPDDWKRSDPTARRMKVRFDYGRECPVPAS